MRVTETDVIVVGAGPTGLMLAAGAAHGRSASGWCSSDNQQVRDVAKAGGLSGQIIDVLRYQGLLERFEAGRDRHPGSQVAIRRLCMSTSPSLPIPRSSC